MNNQFNKLKRQYSCENYLLSENYIKEVFELISKDVIFETGLKDSIYNEFVNQCVIGNALYNMELKYFTDIFNDLIKQEWL